MRTLMFLILFLAALSLGWPGAALSLTITLDFEDGQTPDVHNWQNIPQEPCLPDTSHTIVLANGPSEVGSRALRSSGDDAHGWLQEERS